MTNEVGFLDVLPSIVILGFSALITTLLLVRRKNLGIRALNILILLFSAIFIMGLMEIMNVLYAGIIPAFRVDNDQHPIMQDPVRIANFAFIIILFVFGERILGSRSHRIRSLLVSIFATLIILIGIIDVQQDILLLTNDILPFAQDTRLDEFFFDAMQLLVMLMLVYAFYLQRKVARIDVVRRHSTTLLLAALLYTIAMTYEFLEHLIFPEDFDAFLTGIPTIIVLAYVYVFNPRYIFVVPTEIKFLQIIKDGVPVYAADFEEQQDNMEFLIGPGLFSITSMIGELVNTQGDFNISSIMHSEGLILFEKKDNLLAVIQTSRDSAFLRSSLIYFLEEFNTLYAEELKSKLFLVDHTKLSPDDLLLRCIPIIQSDQFNSTFS